ncbi:MAG: Choline-sulfatase, partial [Verrucomicrobiota bacterium]
GLPAPAGLDGRSLRPQLDRPATPAAKPARGFWTDGQRTIRTERWRLIAARAADGSPQFELFDYTNDPLETRNHAAAHPEVVRDLRAQLDLRPELPAPAGKASGGKNAAGTRRP